MDFIYADKTNRISDDDIIKDLLYVKDVLLKKDKITLREYIAFGKYGSKAIKRTKFSLVLFVLLFGFFI